MKQLITGGITSKHKLKINNKNFVPHEDMFSIGWKLTDRSNR